MYLAEKTDFSTSKTNKQQTCNKSRQIEKVGLPKYEITPLRIEKKSQRWGGLDRMEELNVSQKELAKMLGYSPQYVSNILKGKENLSISTLQKIEEALQLTILPNLAEA